MKITFTGHAGLLIETNDVNILCDPWHSDNPAFFKTWSVYPDNRNLDWDKIISKTDILFVSHFKVLKKIIFKKQRSKSIDSKFSL